MLLDTVKLDSPASRLVYNTDNDLLAVATDDLVVCILSMLLFSLRAQVTVIDGATRKIVRRFRGHQNKINDMVFSPDARWLVTACMDGSVRVFDLPSGLCCVLFRSCVDPVRTGRLIDWFAFDKAVTSLSFSPKSDFLATTHVNNLGIFLWVNRSYFSSVFLRSVPDKPTLMDLPATSAFSTDEGVEAKEDKETMDMSADAKNASNETNLVSLPS